MLDNKKVLSENLTRLLATRSESRLDLSRKMGVADGSLGRIKYGTGNPTLEALEGIARFFRLEVWHLFIPNLDPLNPPKLPGSGPEVETWPFRRIDIRSFQTLPEAEKNFVEGRLAEAISAAADSTKKSDRRNGGKAA